VLAIDRDMSTICFARKHFGHENIEFESAAVQGLKLPPADAAVCFEMIEHMPDPGPMLAQVARAAPILLASAPNETVFPWKGYAFHHRHYTLGEFRDLLTKAGFCIEWQGGQEGPRSPVEPISDGRTIVIQARRAEASVATDTGFNRLKNEAAPSPEPEAEPVIATYSLPVPDRVAILGLGPSLEAYVDIVKRLGARSKLVDEVWGINAVGDAITCDRLFHMDDIRVQERRAQAAPESNIAAMLPWLRQHPGPIYTSVPHPHYPGCIAFPLEEVLNNLGGVAYFNSTAAYAVAYAVHLGVKELLLFGIDFTYANSHQAEKGRACVEYYLGIGKARGMEIGLPAGTSLMDGCATRDDRLYGYDGMDIRFEDSATSAGRRVIMTPRDLPTAEEIEVRYDHSKPTVPEHLLAKSA
jgi:hypothetical protein